ncbi:MAG: Ig domain-containing protein [Thermofilaceae archaeon]
MRRRRSLGGSSDSWRRVIVLMLLFQLFTLISVVPLSLAAAWSIKCIPDPPPLGYAGKAYSVKFTLDTGGQKIDLTRVSWESSPANPVPGLSFSKMIGEDTITLSGIPSRPGTYTFTLTVKYQNERRAEKTVTITILSPPTFNIYMIQLLPSTVDSSSRLRPREIYKGEEVLFVFYTDYEDPSSISWRGVTALPGTNFYVSDKNRVLQHLPPQLYQAALNTMNRIGSSDRLLVLNGKPSASGTFNVVVEARDPHGGGRRAEFRVEVLEPMCTLSIAVEPREVWWDLTEYLFSRTDRIEQKNLTTTIRAMCPVSPYSELRGKLVIRGSESFSFVARPESLGFPLEIYVIYIRLNSSGMGSIELPINVYLNQTQHILEIAEPYPGRSHTLTLSLELMRFNESYTVNEAQFTLRVFFHAPQVNFTRLKPITQYSNPYHVWDARSGRYVKVSDKVVMNKQVTFELYLSIGMPDEYRLAFTMIFGLEFLKSEWEWSYTRVCDNERCILPLSEGSPPFDVRCMNWFQETDHSYRLYTRVGDVWGVDQFIVLEKFEGVRGFWFPKPKVERPSVFVYVAGIKIRGDETIWVWDQRFRRKPFSSNLRVFTFEAIATERRGFRLGYVTVGSYSDLTEITMNFPSGVKRYLEGAFPIEVKEVRYLGSRQVENDGDRLYAFAQELSEELAEANLHKAVVIVPHNYYSSRYLGWVYHAARNVMFVKHETVIDNGMYLCMPVVAHELSHTFEYPDIYYGRLYEQDYCWTCQYYGRAREPGSNEACTGTPYVLGEAAFFDEVNGGLVYYYDLSDLDFMACGGDRYQWVYHSWWQVYEGSASLDPPYGLLISIMIAKNGSVIGRPFSVVYNSSIPYPSEMGVGDVQLQLVSRKGELLKSYPFNITFETYDAPSDRDITGITAVVEWFSDLGEIRLVDSKGSVLFSRKVSLNPPEVVVVYPFDGMRLKAGGNYTITWRGSDPDGDEIWFNVQLRRSGEGSWSILAHRYRGNNLEVQVPSETGHYELMVKATDGVNTVFKLVRLILVEELPKYEVIVTSNVGVQVGGSGLYEEGRNVTLRAPREAPMPGLLGVLGARYEFQRWTGFVESENSAISFIVSEGVGVIRVTAIYRENTTPAFLALGILASVLITATLIAIKLLRKK